MFLSPRKEEVPFILNNIKSGNILNIGGAQGEWKGKLLDKGHQMTIVDVRKCVSNRKNCTVIQADIRDVTSESIGTFDNIILMSTIEHISLPLFSKDNTKTWQDGPWKEQLKVFKHCTTLLKENGIIIFTVPCGTPTKAPRHKLLYNEEMIEAIKTECKIEKEYYILRRPDKWEHRSEFPIECYSSEEEAEKISDSTGRFASAVALLILKKNED